LDPAFRLAARKVLISTYFPPNEQVALYSAAGMTPPSNVEIAKVREDQAAYQAQIRKGRCARFASRVLSGYELTCVLTGYRLITKGSFSLLEAAHIQPHSKHGPDEPENGLALTPTAHGLFDAGLWTVDPSLRVVVPRQAFHETLLPDSPHFSLAALHGRPLFLPGRIRPHERFLAYHREKCFAEARA
jgi:putative restriction endonuclease